MEHWDKTGDFLNEISYAPFPTLIDEFTSVIARHIP